MLFTSTLTVSGWLFFNTEQNIWITSTYISLTLIKLEADLPAYLLSMIFLTGILKKNRTELYLEFLFSRESRRLPYLEL